jgi:S1-C subfamily serine protease
VSPGSPAAQAGLSPSDVIIGLGNNPIQSTGNLLEALDECSYQSAMSLRYLHKGKQVTTTITVTSQPANPSTP